MPKPQPSSTHNASFSQPRPLTQQQRTLITLYSNCQLGMTPQQFYAKWKVTQPDLALICYRSLTTVQRWFSRSRNAKRPTLNDLRHLALMDFLLEHFEEIPQTLFDLLCPRR